MSEMELGKPVHPIIAYADLIEQRGIMVFDNVTEMPLYGEPFITTSLTMVLNQQGWTRVEKDMQEHLFQLHDYAVVAPNHIFCGKEASSDYRCMLIVISEWFQQELKHRYPDIFRINYHYLHQSDVHLSDEQFVVIERLFRTLQDVSQSQSRYYKTIVGDMLEVLFLQMELYRFQNGEAVQQFSPKADLFSQFYDALMQHYRESREVKFYADLFCLSPKYFSAIIKQHTGVNAAEWISNYVILQAKSLLKHRQKMSILQVAHETGFDDQASFSRYFKNRTGLSPMEYRTTFAFPAKTNL